MSEWESNSVVFNKRERAAMRPSLVNISKKNPWNYFTSTNSVSKIKVAFGGITPPAPCFP
jgi:hypothetical protein